MAFVTEEFCERVAKLLCQAYRHGFVCFWCDVEKSYKTACLGAQREQGGFATLLWYQRHVFFFVQTALSAFKCTFCAWFGGQRSMAH